MYLVVIGILALVLTLSRPLYDLVTEPALVFAAAAGASLLPTLVAALVAWRVVRQLDRDPEHPSYGQAIFSRGMLFVQYTLAAAHSALLVGTDWITLCGSTPVVGDWVLVSGLLVLGPFLLSIALVWLVLYPADRGVRQIAVELYLFRGKPLRPVWPLLQYMMYNFRHQVLFVLIPMLLILAAHDVVVLYQAELRSVTGQPYAPDLLIGLAAIGVAVVAPEILRHVWVTQRLPDGPLRDRLVTLARQLRLRYREILVWHSGGLIVNAAVTGIVAPLRYVMITDGMLEQMEDAKIEAVFGHEAGHVKRHHITFFLLFALISGCAVTIFSLRTYKLATSDPGLYQVIATLGGTALILKWGVLFGWISRRFERQADVFGVRALTVGGLPCTQPCMLHTHDAPAPAGSVQRDPRTPVAPASPRTPVAPASSRCNHRLEACATSSGTGSSHAGPLCSTAAQVFAHALNDVALLNGIRPAARSWRHSSISSRARFLQELAGDPPRCARFDRRLLLIKIAIFAVALVAAIWAAHELHVWEALYKLAVSWF